jgi:hypothetical protein
MQHVSLSQMKNATWAELRVKAIGCGNAKKLINFIDHNDIDQR